MYLIGDIGNSEIKVCLINNQKKIIKKINFSNNKISSSKISKSLKIFNRYLPKIEKILFCSVVPTTFKLIKRYLNNKTKIKCNEIKELKLSSLIDIKVNYKQVGSDRLTNAISLINKKISSDQEINDKAYILSKNFIILFSPLLSISLSLKV